MALELVPTSVEPGAHEEWDAFVARSPQGSIYAKAAYLDLLGVPFKILVVRVGGEIRGGLVLARNALGLSTNPLFVKYLGVLHGPVVGNVHRYRSLAHKVERALVDTITRHGVWTYNFHPGYGNWLGFAWHGFQQTTRYTYTLTFPQEDFRRCYDEALRRQLRAGRKKGLRLGPVTAAEVVDGSIAAFTQRGRRPPYGRTWLLERVDGLAGAGLLYSHGVYESDGRLLATGALLYDEGSANLILNGMNRAANPGPANTMLVDHLVEFASCHSRVFDFEGSMHARIERFYRRFGGRLTPYFQIYRSNLATWLYRQALGVVRRMNG